MWMLHQIKGRWLFTFGTETIKKSTRNYDKFSWGRHQPTQIVQFSSDEGEQQKLLNELQGVSSDNQIDSIRQVVYELTDYNNHVYQHQYDGESLSDSKKNIGNWTMTLHEGMMGFIFDEDLNEMITFDSFWRYNLVDNASSKYESIWYETMVGWYHTINSEDSDDEDWGWFYAKKIDPTHDDLDQSKHVYFEGGNPAFKSTSSEDKWVDNVKTKAKSGLLTWHTDESRDVASDSNYVAFSPSFEEDTNGVPSASNISHDNEGKLQELGDYYYLVGKDPQTISDSELPHSLNWNNINGYSFYPKIVKQTWGDCYLVASISCMESRIMIATNGKLKPKLSLQQQKNWNWYIEGWDGGLPVNVAKYGWEFEFTSEEWYSQATPNKCDWSTINSDSCEKYSVRDFYFVGWNYGGASESLIMKEIMAHGPVASVINAPRFMQMYKGGVFMQECPISPDQISKKNFLRSSRIQDRLGIGSHKTLWDKNIEWEFVNHSITIVGWGVVAEDDTDSVFLDDTVIWDQHKANSFWIVANSWGENFGEDGFIRIRRGWNDYAIESEALSFIPLLDSNLLDDSFKNEEYLA